MASRSEIALSAGQAPALPRTRPRGEQVAVRANATDLARRAGPLLATWWLPFILVLYLALKGGGYDLIVRSEIGIAVWWIVLVGAVAGLLPVARIGRVGWTALGLLAAFAVWTGLGIGWSESAERSVAELGRVATYLGVFALALLAGGRDALRRTVGALATAIALVAALALLSRLEPSLFPRDLGPQFMPSIQERLNYPLNYWNGLAGLVAMGVPLLVWAATAARTIPARALATAALPVAALTIVLTLSRAGAGAAVLALLVLLALHPRRLALLPPLLLGGLGSAILIAATLQRDALEKGLLNAAAERQGDEMLAMTLVVCAGVGLLAAALALAERNRLLRWPRVSRRIAVPAFGVVAVIAIVGALIAGAPGELSERWSEFKRPGGTSLGVERLTSVGGNSRYQYWEAAADANATAPLTGIGPGTFEYWWAREGTVAGFVRDAHSLYMETLGELGIVGFALIVGFVGGVLVVGAIRALRRRRGRTSLLAAATAGAFAYGVMAAFDWVWELTVVTVAFLLLAAAIVGPDARARADRAPSRHGGTRVATTAGLAAVAVASLAAIAIPMAGTSSVRESWRQVEGSDLPAALASARAAERVQPYSATARIQEALVLELEGDLPAALAAARAATQHEPTNWRTWFVRSRLEARNGNAQAALRAYRKARSLNPRSSLLNR
jgi:hypothetical protein